MKNMRIIIHDRIARLDRKWRAMPVKKQHHYTLLLFLGYALLSIIVLLKVCYDMAQSDNTLTIEHLKTPLGKVIPRFLRRIV